MVPSTSYAGNNMSNNDKENMFFRHPLIIDLEEISKIDRLTIKRVNFCTGEIVVTIDGCTPGYDGTMQSVRFLDLLDKVSIMSVDFSTGEITTKWYPQGTTKIYENLNLTREEADLVIASKKIEAVKLLRIRTGCGLKEAIDIVDNAKTEMRRRNMIKG